MFSSCGLRFSLPTLDCSELHAHMEERGESKGDLNVQDFCGGRVPRGLGSGAVKHNAYVNISVGAEKDFEDLFLLVGHIWCSVEDDPGL